MRGSLHTSHLRDQAFARCCDRDRFPDRVNCRSPEIDDLVRIHRSNDLIGVLKIGDALHDDAAAPVGTSLMRSHLRAIGPSPSLPVQEPVCTSNLGKILLRAASGIEPRT